MKGIIIAGGSLSGVNEIKKYLTADTIVVCADAGYNHIKDSDIKPDAVIGDFDSMKPDFSGRLTDKNNFEIITYKIEKDETDTQLCIDYLAKRGVKEITLLGALGGKRIDHSVANIQLIEYSMNKGIFMKIADGMTQIFMLSGKNETIITGKAGDIVSVFALDKASGLTYEGLKYPLTNAVVMRNLPYCVSNSMISNTCKISVEAGKILIMHIGGENNG
ncbi:MAG: thiamine diphosphokinase [Bacillota bacterium]|nr:thiamine diphosphokinase [Bacillota bacterium]